MRDADESAGTSTILAEVLPGIVMVYGDPPPELDLERIDLDVLPAADRERIHAAALAALGNAATVGGNLATVAAQSQGLYRLADASRAILDAGATLAVKDGAHLGAMLANGNIVGQARFIPVAALGAAQAVAAIGPAIAMVALQLQLKEITGLVRTNIALTTTVLTQIRHEQWSELTALAGTVERTLSQARKARAVTASLWDTVAVLEADLDKQRKQYRLNVGGHVRQIGQADTRARREYVETHAEAILFDAHALLTSLQAWTGRQALHAAVARAAGSDDPGEARLVEIIVRDTQDAYDDGLAQARQLVGDLTRELRIVAELPGRRTAPLTPRRRDAKAARLTCAQLLEALEPLADALNPPPPALDLPEFVCAPDSFDLEPALRVLRWFLDDDETLRGLGLADPLDAGRPIGAILDAAKDRWAAATDRTRPMSLVAVTDRRIITARTNTLLQQGQLQQNIPLDQVRYVRPPGDAGDRATIDVITRDENLRWAFHPDCEDNAADELRALIAESMSIPDSERDELRRGRLTLTAGDR